MNGAGAVTRERTGQCQSAARNIDGLPDASTLLRDACEHAHATDVLRELAIATSPARSYVPSRPRLRTRA